jgi:hypothetical protein
MSHTIVATILQSNTIRPEPNKKPVPKRKCTKETIIDLTRDFPPSHPMPIVEERTMEKGVAKQKNKSNKWHQWASSEGTISDSPLNNNQEIPSHST